MEDVEKKASGTRVCNDIVIEDTHDPALMGKFQAKCWRVTVAGAGVEVQPPPDGCSWRGPLRENSTDATTDCNGHCPGSKPLQHEGIVLKYEYRTPVPSPTDGAESL